jgi:hypothetical protein
MLEALKEFWALSSTQMFFWSFLAFITAQALWPWLTKLVAKTETKTDDEFLEAIKGFIDEALAKKTKKKAE